MKKLLWNLSVRFNDWFRVFYRKIKPAKKNHTLSIDNLEIDINMILGR
jgi:hypothetical protein